MPSPLTGRVLVEITDTTASLQGILDDIADLERPEQDAGPVPEHPLDSGPIVEASAKTIGSSVGLALLFARRVLNNPGPPIASTGPGEVAGMISLIEGIPAATQWLERVLGHRRKELALGAINAVAMTSYGSVLGLAFAGVGAVRLLSEARARRAAWRAYEQRLGDAPAVYAGAVATLTAGQRAPLAATVLEGHGVAAALDGFPRTLRPGATLDSGARVYGGPVTVRYLAEEVVRPAAELARAKVTFDERYEAAVPLLALVYAGVTGVVTRSAPRALTALLLVNPRPLLAGRASADQAASARVIRGGVTVAGSRAERAVRRPDVVLIHGGRSLCGGWQIARAITLGDRDERQVVELGAAVSTASGSPWGLAPGGQALVALDGRVQDGVASAKLDGERWMLGPAGDASSPIVGVAPDERVLPLRRQGHTSPEGALILRPRLTRGVRILVDTCAALGVRIELVPAAATGGERALAERAGMAVAAADLLARVRELRAAGAVVAVVADGAQAATAFDACDLAIALTSGRSGPFHARADLLAPRLEAAAAVVEAGARRDRAVRDSAAISLATNAAAAAWGARTAPPFRRGAQPALIGGLGAMLDAAVRLRGGRRARSVTERLADPLPERWGRSSVDEVLRHLRTSRGGLATEQARLRRPSLNAERRRSLPFEHIARQLDSPVVGILGAGAALSLAVGALGDLAMIAGVVAGNALVGAWEEGRAGRATEALQEMIARSARVLRDGAEHVVIASELVPGDVILLASGDRVPADARLIEADALEVDEAALTGESMPVAKDPENGFDASRIVLEGTDVTSGTARAVVVAVGVDTRMGAIAAALEEDGDRRSPLDERLARILWRALPWIAIGGAVVTVAGVLWGGAPLPQLALGASVAVAAVPEGLPLLAGVAEAAVARRLAGRRALVTRLSAVEALGRVDVACADKTGTLTTGQLAVTTVADSAGRRAGLDALPVRLREVLAAAAVASPALDAVDAAAHPTDVAVRDAARRLGLDNHAADRQAESRFEPARAFHATVAGGRMYLKGAPEVLLERCTQVRQADGQRRLDGRGRRRLLAFAEGLAADGLRVLMVAFGDRHTSPEDPQDLTALGFIGISDPLRATAPAAVNRCHRAGVRVIMLTGDHVETARTIARQAGLPGDDDRILTGAEIADLDDDELPQRLERTTIIARSTPMDKVRIIDALRGAGHVVAMTGDGVNDAPALRLADVGVAMGRAGTEVARQAADVVLTDDDFSTLVEALVEGRSFWHNIRRALGLLLGGNAGEVLLMTSAAITGLPGPLTTRQVLMVNLVTDVLPALAVSVQPPERRDLSALSREGSAALDAPLRRDIIHRAVATGAPSLAAYLGAARAGNRGAARTVAYTSIVATQLAQTVDLGRVEGRLTGPVLGATLGSVGVLAGTLWLPPARAFLGLTAPSLVGVALSSAAAAAAVLLNRTPLWPA